MRREPRRRRHLVADCVAAYGSNVRADDRGHGDTCTNLPAQELQILRKLRRLLRSLLGGALVVVFCPSYHRAAGGLALWPRNGCAIAVLFLVAVLRERMRHTFERSAQLLVNENEFLKKSSDQLRGDPDMLQDTIGKRSPAHKRPQPSVHRARDAACPRHIFSHARTRRVCARVTQALLATRATTGSANCAASTLAEA